MLLCRAAKPVAESHIAKDAPRQIPSNLKTSPSPIALKPDGTGKPSSKRKGSLATERRALALLDAAILLYFVSLRAGT